MQPRRTAGLPAGVRRPPSLRPARATLRDPSPANAPPRLTVAEVEAHALTTRTEAIKLFDAVKEAADLSHDAYVVHVLHQILGPLLAKHDAWDPDSIHAQKAA
ncbi:hypothetical protein BMF94_6925, partial [Rhodotorula taiwanensis]